MSPDSSVGVSPPAPITPQQPSGLRLHPIAGLLLAAIAAAITLAVLQLAFPLFRPPEELTPKGPFEPPDKLAAFFSANTLAARNNAIVLLAIFGGLVAASLAKGEGAARRSFKLIIIGGFLGMVIGALFGAAAGLAGHHVLAYLQPNADGALAASVKLHAIVLGIVGIGVGLTLGLMARSTRTLGACVLGGLLAGALAGMLYPLVNGLFRRLVNAEVFLPTQLADRAIWLGVAAVALGLFVVAVGRGRAPASA